ncbi:COG1470 family protein [Cetobacterium sp.]|uniref:COG1470 family protein n=1 Tax=Cetobacterium sp. TaxID=2071632 RepID=UPI003F2F6F86
MKKILILFLILTLKTFSYINIYPLKFNERIDGEGAYKEFVLYNKTKEPIRYRVYLEESKEENTMNSWCAIYPKSLTLDPLEEKKIKVHIKAPKNAKEGTYMSKLVIKEINMPKEKKDNVKVMTLLKLKLIGYIGDKK